MYLSPAQSQALLNSPLETQLRPRWVHEAFLDPMLCPHHFLPHPGPLKSLSTLRWALQLVGPVRTWNTANVMMTNNQINELVKHKPGLGHIHQRSSSSPSFQRQSFRGTFTRSPRIFSDTNLIQNINSLGGFYFQFYFFLHLKSLRGYSTEFWVT